MVQSVHVGICGSGGDNLVYRDRLDAASANPNPPLRRPLPALRPVDPPPPRYLPCFGSAISVMISGARTTPRPVLVFLCRVESLGQPIETGGKASIICPGPPIHASTIRASTQQQRPSATHVPRRRKKQGILNRLGWAGLDGCWSARSGWSLCGLLRWGLYFGSGPVEMDDVDDREI